MNPSTISAAELLELWKAGKAIELIDVRTPVEFREQHVAFARNIPLDRLDPNTLRRPNGFASTGAIYFVCRTGGRGQQACEKMRSCSSVNAVNVEGGTMACERAGLPIVRGKKAISLERQVRIAAGTLVLIGVVLGWTIHPALFGISALIGAGLVFSGITDTCGMGLLLARMPWNRCAPMASSGQTCRAQ